MLISRLSMLICVSLVICTVHKVAVKLLNCCGNVSINVSYIINKYYNNDQIQPYTITTHLLHTGALAQDTKKPRLYDIIIQVQPLIVLVTTFYTKFRRSKIIIILQNFAAGHSLKVTLQKCVHIRNQKHPDQCCLKAPYLTIHSNSPNARRYFKLLIRPWK